MALITSQSQLRHNFMLRVSTEVIESRILSSIYRLLTKVIALLEHLGFAILFQDIIFAYKIYFSIKIKANKSIQCTHWFIHY